MPDLLSELDVRSSQIRFDSIDFSAGELIRLNQDGEIAIQPAFQRMFRWTQAQQSRLIESMLLGLPVPQIVLFQREDGILELIDGLQRVSSIIRFITGRAPRAAIDQDDATNLTDCDLLPALNDQTYNTLSSVVQLELKRKTLRAIVIRRTNDPNLRYEMFKRLNAGGSPAEAHEVRNASLRIIGRTGEQFLDFLQRCSDLPSYQILTESMSEQGKRRLGRQELVLRYFALKNFLDAYKGSISDWLDDYGEKVAKGFASFDYGREYATFTAVMTVLAEKFGEQAFVKHKSGRALGGLAPAYFDAVSTGLTPLADRLAKIAPDEAVTLLNEAIGHENEDFRENVGPGANAVPRMRKRIQTVYEVFNTKLPS